MADNKTGKKETNKKVGGSKVMGCTCPSCYQDKVYGDGKRLHNIGSKTSTCTVCGVKR